MRVPRLLLPLLLSRSSEGATEAAADVVCKADPAFCTVASCGIKTVRKRVSTNVAKHA